jgi:hypothetical protein
MMILKGSIVNIIRQKVGLVTEDKDIKSSVQPTIANEQICPHYLFLYIKFYLNIIISHWYSRV